jgi:hypothetical protein
MAFHSIQGKGADRQVVYRGCPTFTCPSDDGRSPTCFLKAGAKDRNLDEAFELTNIHSCVLPRGLFATLQGIVYPETPCGKDTLASVFSQGRCNEVAELRVRGYEEGPGPPELETGFLCALGEQDGGGRRHGGGHLRLCIAMGSDSEVVNM